MPNGTPYETPIFLLDLCILAYQLHAQTLLCPLDPYGEQLTTPGRAAGARNVRRHDFFDGVKRIHLKSTRKTLLHGPAEFGGSRTDGWEPNPTLDVILSDYRQINPWAAALTFARTGEYLVYDAPATEITSRISEVHVASYEENHGPTHAAPQVEFSRLWQQPRTRPAALANQGSDLLYCFEGGTGALGRSAPAMSLMGFVLARQQTPPATGYDVFIVFRGSRSGSLRMHQAAFDERGNPDWVTDTGARPVRNSDINPGLVFEGFERSIVFTLPCVIKCLEAIDAKKGAAPGKIYVAGHSLGGALACYFVSAVNIGTRYGRYGRQLSTQRPLDQWPWRNLELVTFGAPRLGNSQFKDTFNGLVPHCQRIRLANDPIPSLGVLTPLPGGAAGIEQRGLHVGADWELPAGPDGGRAHDPAYIRGALLTWYRHTFAGIALQAPFTAVTAGANVSGPWTTFPAIDAAIARIEQTNPVNFFAGYADTLANYLEAVRGTFRWQEQDQLPRDLIDALRLSNPPANLQLAKTKLTPIHQILTRVAATSGDVAFRAFVDTWLKLAAIGWIPTLRWKDLRDLYADR